MDLTVNMIPKVKQGKQRIRNMQRTAVHIHLHLGVHIQAMAHGGCVRCVRRTVRIGVHMV